MRVVHVGKFYPPEYHGGLEAVVAGISDQLVRRGVGVTAVVAARHGAGGESSWGGAHVIRARSHGTVLSQPIAPALIGAVRRAHGDLLHLHHPNPLGDLAVLRDGRPLLVTHHSDVVRQRVLAPLYMPLVRRAFARARAVAVGSERLLGASRELANAHGKIRVIPFGIDATRFAATPAVQARARELRAPLGELPVVLAVGRLVPYKGFDALLSAVRGLELALVLVGSGPDEPRLTSLAGPEAHFAGRVSDADLVAWYHACNVFCLPSVSIAEAFGIVLLEAMACGKPLVTTALPTGVSDVNRDGRTGLVVSPRDVGALREALVALLADPARRHAMGEHARAVQQAEYTADLMGERYLRLYEEVVGS